MEAKQIWKSGENNENTWMCLARDFDAEDIPKTATARIAVDSKYRLYINGVPAVFEGGIKRGPSKNGTYYDEIDIAGYLKAGKNRIAVLVWYFGKSGFSHNSSGEGGLIFEAELGKQRIISDSSWKIKRHSAYVMADEGDPKPNFRLAEPNIYYDAARDMGDWFKTDYNISLWDNADIIADANTGAWGALKSRTIPMLRDYGLCDYENSAEFKDFTAAEDTAVAMKLPYNAQLTPYFKITAPKGLKIVIKTETYDTIFPEEKNTMSVYYTKDGVQEYEPFGWINGERVYYCFPKGVTVHELKYRESGYDTEFAGSFECDDEFFNKLWQKSLRTLYVTMRDNFMDCPDRERVQWWGDVNVEMQMMMYSLDKSALLLYKKGVDSLAAWAKDCKNMLTVVPSGTEQFELPMQNLAGIAGFMYYYKYTGDIEVIKTAYEMSKNYVLSFDMQPNGLIKHRQGSWDWADWGDNADIAPMENAWYYMALESCGDMAKLLNFTNDIVLYKARMESIEKAYGAEFLHSGYYYDNTENKLPDDRANALAVLSGLGNMSGGLLNILENTENSSPYMEKYALDALCETGNIDAAILRMKRRYREMVEYDYSTLWEYWNTDGTKNHAWSGGPLITMSKYIAGIRPLDTAYSRFIIKPHLGDLTYIKCTVPSIKGNIKLEINKTTMKVTIPENSTAEVYVPTTDGYIKHTLSSGGEYIF